MSSNDTSAFEQVAQLFASGKLPVKDDPSVLYAKVIQPKHGCVIRRVEMPSGDRWFEVFGADQSFNLFPDSELTPEQRETLCGILSS